MSNKSGCPDCFKEKMVGSYNEDLFKVRPDLKDKPAKLYFYRIWNNCEEFYKVGITTTKKRVINGNYYNTELISEVNMSLYDAWKEEQEFLKKFKTYKYVPNYKFGGYTECFKKEIYNIMF